MDSPSGKMASTPFDFPGKKHERMVDCEKACCISRRE